ncbi:hypothetical protein [Chelatococcus daeguensis]|uniref:hypothetical protein n=1 Tax=Chelatococcus daeguensis TaxID=444444 RepID=UPI000903E796
MRLGQTRDHRRRAPGGYRPGPGAKNAALPVLAASLLSGQSLPLSNVADAADLHTMLALLRRLGTAMDVGPSRVLSISSGSLTNTEAIYVRKMRASFRMLGPLAARLGEALFRCPAAAPSAPVPSISTSRPSSGRAPGERSPSAQPILPGWRRRTLTARPRSSIAPAIRR